MASDYVLKRLPKAIRPKRVKPGQHVIVRVPASSVSDLLTALRDLDYAFRGDNWELYLSPGEAYNEEFASAVRREAGRSYVNTLGAVVNLDLRTYSLITNPEVDVPIAEYPEETRLMERLLGRLTRTTLHIKPL